MPEIITLENGVRIVADPMAGLESASVGVWFRAGAIDETAEEQGVAHLLEHMAFKGTTSRTAKQIAEEIENIGGYLNASTGYSRTGYYARVLRNDAGTALEILADILTNPLFDPGELDKERQVVIQEIGEAADIPDDAVMDMLQRLSYGDNALGRPILGTVESVAAHTRERLSGFMVKHYSPGALVIAASGGIDAERIAKLAEACFGARPAGATAPRRLKPAYQGGAAHDPRDIEQTHIAIAFPGAAVRDANYFATRVFAEALGGAMSSRIFQSVREDRGLAYSVYSYADSYDEVGSIGAYVGTDSENAVEAVALIRKEIAAIKVAAPAMAQAVIDRAIQAHGAAVLDAVANVVPAVKINIAFLEPMQEAGLTAYRTLVAEAHRRRLLVIGDVKRADIGHTSTMYAWAHLGAADVARGIFRRRMSASAAPAIRASAFVAYRSANSILDWPEQR